MRPALPPPPSKLYTSISVHPFTNLYTSLNLLLTPTPHTYSLPLRPTPTLYPYALHLLYPYSLPLLSNPGGRAWESAWGKSLGGEPTLYPYSTLNLYPYSIPTIYP